MPCMPLRLGSRVPPFAKGSSGLLKQPAELSNHCGFSDRHDATKPPDVATVETRTPLIPRLMASVLDAKLSGLPLTGRPPP